MVLHRYTLHCSLSSICKCLGLFCFRNISLWKSESLLFLLLSQRIDWLESFHCIQSSASKSSLDQSEHSCSWNPHSNKNHPSWYIILSPEPCHCETGRHRERHLPYTFCHIHWADLFPKLSMPYLVKLPNIHIVPILSNLRLKVKLLIELI